MDPDGDVYEDDDVDSTVELTDLEEDPYRDIRVEGMALAAITRPPLTLAELLMPLKSAGALKDHPTLSVSYTSRALDEIIHNAQEMVQREQHNLWRLKQLTNGLRGDASFMPCGAFETDADCLLIQNAATSTSRESSVEPLEDNTNGISAADDMSLVELDASMLTTDEQHGGEDISIITRESAPSHDKTNGALPSGGVSREDQEPHPFDDAEAKPETVDSGPGPSSKDPDLNGETNPNERNEKHSFDPSALISLDPDETMELEDEAQQHSQTQEDEEQDANADADDAPQHRMTTRAKAAEAPSSPTPSSTSSTSLSPHPFFLLPPSTLPSRDLGLPPTEAAETRRLMSAFVQKQEDAVRNSLTLLNGLLRAKRYRDTVMEWCTAEAHVGEMSDGEDWYDAEFWNIEGELKKGTEEVEGEEEMGVGGRKKTRRARGAGN